MFIAFLLLAGATLAAADGDGRAHRIAEAIRGLSNAQNRGAILVNGLRQEYGDDLDARLHNWVARRVFVDNNGRGDPLAEGELSGMAALRTELCPGAESASWEADLSATWDAAMATIWERCAVGEYGLLSRDEFLNSAGPESGLLGSALYGALRKRGAGADDAAYLGRLVANVTADPARKLLRETWGTVGFATHGVELVRSTTTVSVGGGCLPIVAVAPGRITVDGQPRPLGSLDEGLRDCREHAKPVESDAHGFKGRVLIAADRHAPFGDVYAVIQEAKHARYVKYHLLLLRVPGPPTEFTPIASLEVFLPTQVPSIEPPDARIEIHIGAGYSVVTGKTQHADIPLGDVRALDALLRAHKSEHPDQEELLLSADAGIEWSAVVAVMDATRAVGSGEGSWGFPWVVLLAPPDSKSPSPK